METTRDKLVHQLFVGMVAEMIGTTITLAMLKKAKEASGPPDTIVQKYPIGSDPSAEIPRPEPQAYDILHSLQKTNPNDDWRIYWDKQIQKHTIMTEQYYQEETARDGNKKYERIIP